MAEMSMGPAEAQFADIIWDNEPIASGELAKRALEVLNWKKTTSYTVLKRLCDRGLFRNTQGIVTSLISRQEYRAMQSERYVRDHFGGSLPAFLAAFTSRRRLSEEELAQMRQLVEQMEED